MVLALLKIHIKTTLIKASSDKGYPKVMAKLSDIYISSIYGLNDADASKIYADLAINTYNN